MSDDLRQVAIHFLPTAPSHFAPTREKQRRQSENRKDLKIIYSSLLLQ